MALAYIVLHEGNFLEAVKDGVSSGRDTDSIGVMIGAILGAMQGVQVIPADEIAVLEAANRQDFETSVSRFIEAASSIILQDLEADRARLERLHSIQV
ncbi:ADP-ribosylglycohydrolase family protein [Paenibacillus sp. P25]|nr:ADP-ribosylglycohydrolase family protein [Paenibacillus sp. P25]